LNFQENYNKLQSEKANIVKDAEASKHLISKLDELYDGLWVSLESKKNEAVSERQKLLNSNMLNLEI
jgi:1-aminocyclopropane-1-carboxylate deaminase/D-cysteine desulfhydrase-like pyridoxal-dependent ACC family enzyme